MLGGGEGILQGAGIAGGSAQWQYNGPFSRGRGKPRKKKKSFGDPALFGPASPMPIIAKVSGGYSLALSRRGGGGEGQPGAPGNKSEEEAGGEDRLLHEPGPISGLRCRRRVGVRVSGVRGETLQGTLGSQARGENDTARIRKRVGKKVVGSSRVQLQRRRKEAALSSIFLVKGKGRV